MILNLNYSGLNQDSLGYYHLEDVQFLEKEERYDSAVKILSEIIQIADSSKDDNLKGKVYLRMGTILCTTHRCEQGSQYFLKALKTGLLLNSNELVGKSYLGIGASKLVDHDLDSSIHFFREAIPFLKKAELNSDLLGTYNNIGLVYLELKNHDSSAYYLEKALLINDESDSLNIIEGYFNMGGLFKAKEDFNKALNYFQKCYDLARSSKNLLHEYKSLKEIGEINFEKGNYEEAASTFVRYNNLVTEHINLDYSDKILELETKFKTAEIERDNALKQAEIEENRRQLFILYAFSFLLILASVSTYLFFNQRRKRQKLASEKAIQDLLQNQEMKTTYALLEGQDKERKRIAAELHDNLGSILVTLNMYADTLQNKKPKDIPTLAQKIADAAQLANTETRKISHSLDSGMLRHFGLEAAIKQLTEAVSSARKIKFNLSLQTGEISSDASIEIYRIIQELVNNTLKHAQCTKVHLELTHVDHSFSIIYEDNGVGFNPKEVDSGMGLKNIQNRAERLDGELTIDSTPGKGSSFIIEIPHL